MQRLGPNAEPVGISADFIERDQAVVDVKSRVLDSLGHHRSGHLLELAGEPPLFGSVIVAGGSDGVSEQHVADEAEDAAAHERVAHPRPPDGRLDIAPIGRARAGGVDVRAINRKARDHFPQCIPQGVEGKVARAPRLLGQAVELMGQHVQLARQRHLHDQQLLAVDQVGKARTLAGKVVVDPADGVDVVAIHEQAADLVQEVVAAGAVNRPGLDEGSRAIPGFSRPRHKAAEPRWPSPAGESSGGDPIAELSVPRPSSRQPRERGSASKARRARARIV